MVGPGGKLKNWKSEKLTSALVTQLARISGFHPPHLLIENLGGGFRVGVGRQYVSYYIDHIVIRVIDGPSIIKTL
jgi:hypothetical protein